MSFEIFMPEVNDFLEIGWHLRLLSRYEDSSYIPM
jgi:hypothetical protein